MKKIMFNDKYSLTKAVLNGIKTMTRRIIPLTDTDRDYLEKAFDWDLRESVIIDRYARYKAGEIVAVAQNYHDVYEELKLTHGSSSSVTREFFHKYVQGGRMPVSNKMFVAAELMPHRIRITGIKVERLQDISDEDCMREGLWRLAGTNLYHYDESITRKGRSLYHTPREAFSALIDKVSGKGTWDSNPFVFAYTFELERRQA